jgi:hypothetical protein
MQRHDGFVPEEIFWGARTQLENDELLLQWTNNRHSDITQYPVLPFALRAIYDATGDAAFIVEFLPQLVRYLQWWRRARDDGDGLVTILHNWEGLDASPAYDPAFHVNVSRVDSSSFLLLYPKFLELTASYNFEFHWNESRIMNRSRCAPCSPIDRWFQVKDVGINSVYAAGWGVLEQLASAVNDTATAQFCAKEASISASAIMSKMLDPSSGGFRSLFVDWDGQEKTASANAVQNLLPLLLPSLPPSVVDSLVAEVLSFVILCCSLTSTVDSSTLWTSQKRICRYRATRNLTVHFRSQQSLWTIHMCNISLIPRISLSFCSFFDSFLCAHSRF